MSKRELISTAVAIVLAIPTYPSEVPVLLKAVLLAIAVALLVWTWLPHRFLGVNVTFGLALSFAGLILLVAGVPLHFLAPRFLAPEEDKHPTGALFNLSDNADPTVNGGTFLIDRPFYRGDKNSKGTFTDIYQAPPSETDTFPPSDGTLKRDTNQQLKQLAHDLGGDLRNLQRAWDEQNANDEKQVSGLPQPQRSAERNKLYQQTAQRMISRYQLVYAKPVLALASEIMARAKHPLQKPAVLPDRRGPEVDIRVGWSNAKRGRLDGPQAAAAVAVFLEFISNQVL